MADDEPNQLRSKCWLALVFVPVFYVLSIGPVAWTVHTLENHLSAPANARIREAVEVIYAPLLWSSEQMPWLYDVLYWYAHLIK